MQIAGLLPRWLAGSSAIGLSNRYAKFCVASRSDEQLYTSRGCDPRGLVLTGGVASTIADVVRSLLGHERPASRTEASSSLDTHTRRNAVAAAI